MLSAPDSPYRFESSYEIALDSAVELVQVRSVTYVSDWSPANSSFLQSRHKSKDIEAIFHYKPVVQF
jgi:hypothetical protein